MIGLPQRVSKINRNAAIIDAAVESPYASRFRVSPTCPPSTAVNIRSGLAVINYRWGDIQDKTYFPDAVCDFTATDETQLPCNFSNSRYYLGIILCYHDDWLLSSTEPPYTIVGGASEHLAAASAEQEIDGLLNGTDDWLVEVLPLAAIVLRNNGILGEDGQVLAIDALNRGRGYIYRDIRLRNMLQR